ncbi:MAG: hypothetical protein L3J06_02990 [Cyclobacteriaceae bacterium]|nr:hypothetical protein [Cyclobacteriaceae bacterium]
MKRISFIVLLVTTNLLSFSQHISINTTIMPAETDPVQLQIPSIVGPNLYELYTDAHLYITRVFVNGVEKELRNAKGNGMISKNDHSFSGPVGYYNKIILNAYMRKGDNEIQVVFEPSPIIAEIVDKGVEPLFSEGIFARALIVRGALAEGSLGVSTEEIDKLLAIDHPEVNVLDDKLVKNISEENINKPVKMTFTINVSENEMEHLGQLQYCEGAINTSCNFTANLVLNGTPILHIKNNVSTIIEPFNKIVQSHNNTLELQVLSINDKTKESYFEYYLNYEMEDIVKKIGLEPRYNYVSFGDFFNALRLPLWTLSINEEGSYKASFDLLTGK